MDQLNEKSKNFIFKKRSMNKKNRFKEEILEDELSQLNPTPLAISVAKKGIEAKPTNSTLIINLNLETIDSVTLGRAPLLRGIAHKTYVIVG